MEEFLILVTALMEEEEALDRKRQLRSLRDKSDPFSMNEYTFIQNFGFPKSLCKSLIQDLEVHDQKTSIPFTLRFLACLYFYKHGSHQKTMENCETIPMSQPSISRSIHTVSELIVKIKANEEIKFPMSEKDISEVKKGFELKFGLKDIIGAIDCTHVGIRQPSEAESEGCPGNFMNKTGTFSMNVEAICDHRLMFRAVNAKFPGCCSRSDVWMNTTIRAHLYKSYKKQRDMKLFLLGGKGYPVEPWLLTPLPEPMNSKEIEFNNLHAKGHNTIQKAFGALRTRFRCLSKYRLLHYSPIKTCNIIYACIILHNILLKHGMAADVDLEELSKETAKLKQQEKSQDVADDIEESDVDEEMFEIKEGAKVRERYLNNF